MKSSSKLLETLKYSRVWQILKGRNAVYEQAREEEILNYLPLVERVVKRISVKSLDYDYDDLFNIGVIGLMDAIKKFDTTKKVPFESYAAIRIRGTVLDEIRRNAKLSRYKMGIVNHYYLVKEELAQRFKREATDVEICQEMQIDAKQLGEIYESVHYLSSLSLESTLFHQENGGMELKDTLVDGNNEDAEKKIIAAEKEQVLTDAIAQLAEREQIILNLYYKEELTLKEIAAVLDISTARTSQIHGKIISKLKLKIMEEMS